MRKLIFHIDVNSAYLSWEAARRVAKGEPDLRLIPSAIGGDREKRTGVILSKSQAAKKFGVKTGEPVGAALTILAAGFVLPVLPYLLSFAAGAMVYVVVEELIPESQSGEHTNIGTIGVAIGFVIMMVLDVALG